MQFLGCKNALKYACDTRFPTDPNGGSYSSLPDYHYYNYVLL